MNSSRGRSSSQRQRLSADPPGQCPFFKKILRPLRPTFVQPVGYWCPKCGGLGPCLEHLASNPVLPLSPWCPRKRNFCVLPFLLSLLLLIVC